MDSLELLTSDEDEIYATSFPDQSNHELQQQINETQGSIEETAQFTFPPSKAEHDVTFSKKSYDALRSIPSPTSTYLEKEEEHRKATEEILIRNSSSPLVISKLKLVPEDGNHEDPLVPVFERDYVATDEDEGFVIEHNDSEQILANHEFKTGRHSRHYSDNRFSSLRTIRNTIHGSVNSLPHNLRLSSHDPSIFLAKSSSKRSSRLQPVKAGGTHVAMSLDGISKDGLNREDNCLSIPNNDGPVQIKNYSSELKNSPLRQSNPDFSGSSSRSLSHNNEYHDVQNISVQKGSVKFPRSNSLHVGADVSVLSNGNVELQMTKEQFKIQTLLGQMKNLEIENEKLQNRLDSFGSFEQVSASEKENLYKERIHVLEERLQASQKEVMKVKFKNEELLEIYEEEEQMINSMEETLLNYELYTKDLILFIQEKVQHNQKNDQFQTLNNRYKVKNFEEGDIDGNFRNIYRFMKTIFDLLIESNMEREFLREEMMHDVIDSTSISPPKVKSNENISQSNSASPAKKASNNGATNSITIPAPNMASNRDAVDSASSFPLGIAPANDMVENTDNLNNKLFRIENLVEALVQKNAEEENKMPSQSNIKMKSELESDSNIVYGDKLNHIESKIADIYDMIQNKKLLDSKKAATEFEIQSSRHHQLELQLQELEGQNANSRVAIEQQNVLIEKLYNLIDKTKTVNSNFYHLILEFCNNFIINLLNNIETGDKQSLLKPVKKLNKIEFLLTTSFEDSANIIVGHFATLLKFIEQSVDVIIQKFNEDVIDKNKSLNYAIKNNLHSKWENQNDIKLKRKLTMKR